MKPKRTYLEWTRLYFVIHCGVLLLPVIGLSGFISSQFLLRQLRLKPVQGTILVSRAEPCSDGTFRPRITFSYTINRQTLTTGRYREDEKLLCQSEVEVNELLAEYRPGTVTEAWYDPKHVRFAVLDHSPGIVQLISFIVAVVGLLILIFLLRHYRAGKRKRKQLSAEE